MATKGRVTALGGSHRGKSPDTRAADEAAEGVLLDHEGIVRGWSGLATILTGRTEEDAVGRHFDSLCRDCEIAPLLEAGGERSFSLVIDLDSVDGDSEPVHAEFIADYGPRGRLEGYRVSFHPDAQPNLTGVAFDVGEESLDAPAVQALAAQNAAAFLVDASDSLRILDANAAASRAIGREASELTGLRLSDVVSLDHAGGGDNPQVGIVSPPLASLASVDGEPRSYGVAMVPVRWDERPLALCILHDVSDWVAMRRDLTRMNLELSRLARHDHLTGLFNRPMFLDTLALANSRLGRLGGLLGILYIDLDEFKPVNDRFGHDIGDRVLVEAAHRLKSGVRSSDVVGRLGGDEFGAILENLRRREDALRVARNIIERLGEPFEIEGEPVELSACVGAVVVDRTVPDSGFLVTLADRQMYEAKALGRGQASLAPARVSGRPE